MNKILGVDKAAQALPQSARIIANKLPEAAKALTANAPETAERGAKVIADSLPEAAKALGESIDVSSIKIQYEPTEIEKMIGMINAASGATAATGILIFALAYFYKVVARSKL
eukprot:TRINITY_DN688_c0_g1_i1.p1 TRINITY_DN688_c0_g1~~TRINITY_DN688_c0_g1_i1.p1  ORF type:complete len:113 (-),score=42.42 TRINITY_DN688_c0_g1_i1:157-495(-)